MKLFRKKLLSHSLSAKFFFYNGIDIHVFLLKKILSKNKITQEKHDSKKPDVDKNRQTDILTYELFPNNI